MLSNRGGRAGSTRLIAGGIGVTRTDSAERCHSRNAILLHFFKEELPREAWSRIPMVGLFVDLGHLGVRDEAFALTVSQLIVRQMSDWNVVLQGSQP